MCEEEKREIQCVCVCVRACMNVCMYVHVWDEN